MEIISAKIERTYLSLSREQYDKGFCTVLASRRVYLPKALAEERGRSRPDDLAKLLHESLKDSAIPGKELALYLGTKTAFFASYTLGEDLKEEAKEKRRQGEEDRLFENLEDRPLTARYDFAGETEGLVSGALIASDEVFVETLVAELKAFGYTVVLVSSSLPAYAEALRPATRGAGRVLALDVDKSGMRAIRFENGEPVFLSEYQFAEPGTDAAGASAAHAVGVSAAAAQAAKLVKPDTKILFTGFLAGQPELAAALAALPGVIYCRPLSFSLKGVRNSLAFEGELAGREAMLPGIFSGIGVNPTSPHLPNLIRQKAKEEKRRGKPLLALCVVALLIAVGACAVPLVNMLLAQYKLDENKTVFLYEGNAAAREKLTERRDLTAMLSELKAAGDFLPADALSYVNVIEELKISLLMNGELTELSFEKGSGLQIDLTTRDPEAFDEMKAVIENGGRMEIIEPTEREVVTVGKTEITHIRINVLAGNELR
ncbi:hypothetical protein AGMMS49983_07570 [Clostridia bacterium]|nr:hypothetical protein AGMMS49983_07570 [Clostridia bacterium]